MSWNVNIAKAASKQEAKDKLRENSGWADVPAAVCLLIDAAIDALPEIEDSTLSVATYGHFQPGEWGRGTSNATITISNAFAEKAADA